MRLEHWLFTIPLRLRSVFRRNKVENELEEELQFHFDQRVEEFVAKGLPPAEAKLAARRAMGGIEQRKEDARDTRRVKWFTDFTDDLRFAFRRLVNTPGFTLIAIVTLGAGIGANTSAFSVLNEVFLRPLPYPDSQSLDRIYRKTAQTSRGSVSAADYLDARQQLSSYGEITAYGVFDVSLAEPGEPAQFAGGLRIAENFWSVLRVEPQFGRAFRADESIFGNHRVVMLSDKYWKSRFAGERSILGRTVRLNGEPHEVIGILPSAIDDWRHIGAFDVFRPLALTAEETVDRTTAWLRLVGRRSPATSEDQARAAIAEFSRRLSVEHPQVHAGTNWRTLSLVVATAPDYGPGIFAMLIALSGFVLLIACSNLANLLLARTMGRARELAVRTAIGASRLRLLRPLFAEALLLALAGGAGAVGFAYVANAWLRTMGEVGVFQFDIDWRILSWAFGACLFTVLVFGVAPAMFALRLDPNQTLKTGSRGVTSDRGHQRFRSALIVGQFALAMVLLAGASLFVRGVYDANNKEYGWQAGRLVTGTMLLPAAAYPGPEQVAEFQRLAVERLTALPGVEAASLSYTMPFFGVAETRKYAIAGQETPKPGQEPVATTNGVSPEYFETVGTRIVEGRAFTAADTRNSPRVFIVNQGVVRGLFNGESPIGRRIAHAPGKGALEWGEIVGVAKDTQSIYPDRVPLAYQIYLPLAQEARSATEIAVRTTNGAPSSLIEGVREAVAALDEDLAIRQLQPAEVSIAQANKSWQILGSMLTYLAALGLGLASLGLYSVIARTTALRSTEFGIRIALGAQLRDITRQVLGSAARLAVIGSAIGLVGAAIVARLIATGFPAMRTDTPLVLPAVTLFLIGVSFLASWLPARRAARVDPVSALRAE
jgi:putative ABC transport system permease protein